MIFMVKISKENPSVYSLLKQILIPVSAFAIIASRHSNHSTIRLLSSLVFIFVSVFSAVYHADILARRIGEPFGSLVLALSVTTIEVSIIISIIFSGGDDVAVLARHTVFAAVMIILTGMTGLTLLIGGIKFMSLNFHRRELIQRL